MQLPVHQIERFYRIWFALLHYVNKQKRLAPAFPDAPGNAKRGLSHKMVEQHVGNIAAFAQETLLTQDPPHGLLDTTLADVQAYLSTAENETTVTSFKRFVRFLTETGRMEYGQAEVLRDFLKHA